ncbi:MAG: peptidoglycan recognition family protein [Planctomycetota bacterium]
MARSPSRPSRVLLALFAAAILYPGRGCATEQSTSSLPMPAWSTPESRHTTRTFESTPPVDMTAFESRPVPAVNTAPEASSALSLNVLSRMRWTSTRPIRRDLYALGVGRVITIHHDAIPLTSTSEGAARRRLESIRKTHVETNGWSDIGYHFAIDRAGRIWEARPLLYQGAHVKNHNPGNIGIVLLGDFETQTPSRPQLDQMSSLVRALRSRFNVPATSVVTHQEWPGASTDCPGRSLQAQVNRMRTEGAFGR